MKKIISIFFATMVICLFSSCILINPEYEETYSFYFFNNSDYEVRDWYLIDKYGDTYSKYNDIYACGIESGEISSIKDLKKQDYKLYFEYYDSLGYLHDHTTAYTELYCDTTYKMREKSFYEGKPRSAEVTSE